MEFKKNDTVLFHCYESDTDLFIPGVAMIGIVYADRVGSIQVLARRTDGIDEFLDFDYSDSFGYLGSWNNEAYFNKVKKLP